jgi:hypothetical protein
MNGYVALYKGKRYEVLAETTYQAQGLAARHFGVKPSRAYTVSVTLAEKDGKQIVHSTAGL